METIKERIFNVMELVFEESKENISEESSIDSLENWDSLRHLNLVLGLEEEFDITIPDEEVATITNYKLIEIVINEQLAK